MTVLQVRAMFASVAPCDDVPRRTTGVDDASDQTERFMSQERRYLIEVAGDPVGLVVQERGGFRFFSSSKDHGRLDRRMFRSPGHAEQACIDLINWPTALVSSMTICWDDLRA
jgi:hypothetical protein